MEHPGQAVDGRDHVEEYERDGRREGDREEPAEDFMSDLTRHGSLFIGLIHHYVPGPEIILVNVV